MRTLFVLKGKKLLLVNIPSHQDIGISGIGSDSGASNTRSDPTEGSNWENNSDNWENEELNWEDA